MSPSATTTDATLPFAIGLIGGLQPPADRALAYARRMEDRGYGGLWFPDVFQGWVPRSLWTAAVTGLANGRGSPDIFFDPIAAMAAAAQVTQKIKLGTGVTEVLRRHPAQLAQAALTLEHLAPGRILLGIGAGEPAKQARFGVSVGQPVGRLEEGLAILRLLWSTDEPVDFDGRHFQLDHAALGLNPPVSGPPKIWVAAHGPRMLRMTAKYADGWLPVYTPLDLYVSRLATLRALLAEAGRPADAIVPAMFAGVVVGESQAHVRELLGAPLVRFMAATLSPDFYRDRGFEPPLGDRYGMLELDPSRLSPEDAMRIAERVPVELVRETILSGTVDEVADQICGFRHAGVKHLVLMNQTFYADASLARSSSRLLDEILALVTSTK